MAKFKELNFKQSAGIGRKTGIELIESAFQGIQARRNKEKYGPDLILYGADDQAIGYVDVEVRHLWTGALFPFGSFHVPYRKAKWLSRNIVFVVFNRHLSLAVLIPGSVVKKSRVICESNRRMLNENLYDIPKTTEGLVAYGKFGSEWRII